LELNIVCEIIIYDVNLLVVVREPRSCDTDHVR